VTLLTCLSRNWTYRDLTDLFELKLGLDRHLTDLLEMKLDLHHDLTDLLELKLALYHDLSYLLQLKFCTLFTLLSSFCFGFLSFLICIYTYSQLRCSETVALPISPVSQAMCRQRELSDCGY
jgi:hypothetical protein